MENRTGQAMKHKALAAALSASTGLAGMAALGRCSGGGCSTCLGCAVPGLGILVLAVMSRFGWTKPAAD